MDDWPGNKPRDMPGALSLSKRRLPCAPFGTGHCHWRGGGQLHGSALSTGEPEGGRGQKQSCLFASALDCICWRREDGAFKSIRSKFRS
jgi:hypothetical protein